MRIGFFPLLFLIFLTLKLTGYITWPWLWVTAPLWGPVAIYASIFLAAVLIAGLSAVVAAAVERK